MKRNVTFAFLLSVATLCSNSVAEDNKNTTFKLSKLKFRCLIPCDQSQDNPICATDGKNYGSPKALICYQMCGRNIQVAYFGKCKDEDSNFIKEEWIDKKNIQES